MRQAWALFVASVKMLVRDRAALVGTVVFPIVFVGVFSLFDITLTEGELSPADAGDSAYFDFVLPGLLALGLMNFTMVGIAGSVARFKEVRVLRRITATPLSPSAFIAAQVAARLVLAIVQLFIMLGFGVALGGSISGNPLDLIALATLGNLTFLSLGFAIAGLTRSVDAANNTAGLATAPLMFLSGMFLPVESLPSAVQWIAAVLPITPLISSMRAVALTGATLADLAPQIAYLAAWVPISFVLARLTFRFSQG